MKSVQQSRVRRGAALTELAFTLPVFLMLTLGAIELGNGIHVKQSLTLAAYEAAQTVTKPGGTKAKATDQANNILNSRGSKGHDRLLSRSRYQFAIGYECHRDDSGADLR